MKIVNRHQAAVVNTPHNSVIRPLIDRTTSGVKLCSLAEEVLPPGAAVIPHYHLETEEIYYILSGTGAMRINSETRDVSAGDSIYIPRRAVHSIENTGSQPMTLLLICGAAYSINDHYPA